MCAISCRGGRRTGRGEAPGVRVREQATLTDHRTTARRITRTLFVAQSLGSAATVAIFPIVAIAGAQLSGRPSWAGVPAAVYLLGQAVSAFGWGQLMGLLGRRMALVLGMVLGAAGAALAASSILLHSFAGFLGGSALIGAAVSAVQLARLVAAKVHPPGERGRAISSVRAGRNRRRDPGTVARWSHGSSSTPRGS